MFTSFRNILFICGGILALIIGLTIYSEHVMQVEHVLTIASVLTVVGVGARYVLHCHFTLFHVKFVAFLATFLLKLKKNEGNFQKRWKSSKDSFLYTLREGFLSTKKCSLQATNFSHATDCSRKIARG